MHVGEAIQGRQEWISSSMGGAGVKGGMARQRARGGERKTDAAYFISFVKSSFHCTAACVGNGQGRGCVGKEWV